MMSQSGPSIDPRRRADRYKTDSVRCPLGDVIDLSKVGVRIECKGKPPIGKGEIGTIRLGCLDGAIEVPVRVAWIKCCGFRRYRVGMEFVNVRPVVAKALDALARFGFLRPPGQASTETNEQAKPFRASASLPDYYAVLGVPPSATDEEISHAYRQLARELHPDVSSRPDAAERFMEVQRAASVLRDPERRRMYDMRDVA